MRVALLFDNFGPYHLARACAAAKVCDLMVVEFGASSADYQWAAASKQNLRAVTLNEEGPSRLMSSSVFWERLAGALASFDPEVVLVPGWSTRGALMALRWCRQRLIPAIVMSESTAWDHPRRWISERVKRSVVSHFSAGLVGGSAHQDYLVQLGMDASKLFRGYDVVDNDFFSRHCQQVRTGEQSIHPYFLASNRMIERKNLGTLLLAYKRYLDAFRTRQDSSNTLSREANHSGVNDGGDDTRGNLLHGCSPWGLCLLGDGPLRHELETQASALSMNVSGSTPWGSLRREEGVALDRRVSETEQGQVWFPGFRQIEELPRFYAHAGCFIHPSRAEPWGLVVNEAMASGLPVLVSRRCGCAADLVDEGRNGFTFDPADVDTLSEQMSDIAGGKLSSTEMGEAGRQKIACYSPASFATGLLSASRIAREDGFPPVKRVDSSVFRGLQWLR